MAQKIASASFFKTVKSSIKMESAGESMVRQPSKNVSHSSKPSSPSVMPKAVTTPSKHLIISSPFFLLTNDR